MKHPGRTLIGLSFLLIGLLGAGVFATGFTAPSGKEQKNFDKIIRDNAEDMVKDGRQIFRFDTFGDEAFWGDTLQLHRAIEGAKLGGVGSGVSPRTALAVGLKVDLDALQLSVVQALKAGRVNLDDPAVTLALLKLNAVVGLTGFFNQAGTLRSMGIQCALCHSTVDNALAPGSGTDWMGGPTVT